MDLRYIFLILLLEAFRPCNGFHFQQSNITAISRLNNGDTFNTEGDDDCTADRCVGLSSGTAAVVEDPKEPSCTCQCHRHLPAFREDLQICVDDIRECSLAPFTSSSTSQQIPFVFLPLKSQIIHPSKEIHFPGIVTPICAVSEAKFLTSNGWVDLRNPSDSDVPFRLFLDEGRTFLQWEGEPALRNRMGGRLVLVYLMCRDLNTEQRLEQQEDVVFSRCVAFRVVGTPLKYTNSVSEVIFSPNAQSSDDSDGTGMSISEIVAIGICSILLGLIYVASVFLYLHIRKRRRDAEKKIEGRDNPSLSAVEEGIIKNNPLLGLGRHFVPPDTGFSDSTESDTDVTPDILQNHDDRKKNLQITSALIHPYRHDVTPYRSLHGLDSFHQDSSSIERLPEENVSIVETLEGREDRPENVKAIGITRKKLYFNPAYFEPHLLQTPPPAAIEFLTKIREVITIAKQKMASKRFAPNLLGIPEEDTCYSIETLNDYSHSLNSRRGSMISLKRENSRRKICSGCPDCQPKDFHSLCGKLPEFPSMVACESCSVATESKQHSIRKWLEDIPTLKPLTIDSKSLQSLPLISSPKRIRSPTRSLPTHNASSPMRALSPRPRSERAKSPKSVHSLSSNKSSSSSGRRRKAVVKPKAPPPPLPAYALEHQYDSIPSLHSDHQKLPPPDMIHEALSVEEETRIPTITKKKMNAVINEFAKTLPSVELVKNIDYETDSLERSSRNKGFSTPTEYGDVSSSHPSPSLSNALPMDEEMTMQNAIINTKTGNMTISKLNMDTLHGENDDYELIVLKKGDNVYSLPELLQRGNLVSEVYVNNGYNYSSAPSSISSNSSTLENIKPKVRYDNDKPGHLLIEVEDCPDNYIRVEDSDEFEPDTLDRKPSKLSVKKEIRIDNDDYTDSLERPKHILLRTTGSFKNENLTPIITETTNFVRTFGSLREIYEAKTKRHQDPIIPTDGTDVITWKDGLTDDYEGKILTLEERHSKRQRKSPNNTNDVQPDVIPPNSPGDDAPIYERPKPPRKVAKADLGKPPLPPKTLNRKNKEYENQNYETPPKKPEFTNKVATFSNQNTELSNKKTEFTNQKSEYDTLGNSNKKSDTSILKNFMQADNIFFKNGINNQFILQAQTFTNGPNLDHTSFKIPNGGPTWKFKTSLAKYLQKPEDCGYLSTDSDESRKKKTVPLESEGSAGAGSETDESFCDGHSESGAESIETHSVFFDSFRKPSCFTGSLDSGVDSDLKMNSFTNLMVDDGASSDSENVSFKTVVTTRTS